MMVVVELRGEGKGERGGGRRIGGGWCRIRRELGWWWLRGGGIEELVNVEGRNRRRGRLILRCPRRSHGCEAQFL